MKRLRNHLIGVEQGDIVLFSHYESGGKMWIGTGPRTHREAVRFSESFRTPPSVQAHLTMLDTDSNTNARLDLTVEGVTTEGFTIVFRTWDDTKVARVRAGWIAIGEMRHADEWELY